MIEHPQVRRQVQEHRSQVALEVLLVLYAVLATIVLIRTVLVLLGVTERVWVGAFVFGLTAPVTDALAMVPGFGRALIGRLTMVDLILLGMVLLFPLGVAATSGRNHR